MPILGDITSGVRNKLSSDLAGKLGKELSGRAPEITAKGFTTGIVALKTVNPVAYNVAKTGIKASAKALTEISNILDKENITAQDVEKVLSGINDSCVRDMVMRALGTAIGLCGGK
jgi:hypothetical protein